MPDREKVIQAIRQCADGTTCTNCPYSINSRRTKEECLWDAIWDAVKLLEEQHSNDLGGKE